MADEDNPLDVLSQMEKGKGPGDFGRMGERKQKQETPVSEWKPIYLWILLIVIVASVAGYLIYKNYNNAKDKEIQSRDPLLEVFRDDYYVYNNYEFRKDINGIWNTELYDPINNDVYKIGLHYGPKDLIDIPINRKSKDLLAYSLNYTPVGADIGKKHGSLFLQLDPYIESARLSLAFYEAKTSLEQVFNLLIGPVFTEIHPKRPEIPVRKCGETDEPIIYLKWEDPAQIQMVSDSCVIVSGTEFEMVRAVNRLLLFYYGIMP